MAATPSTMSPLGTVAPDFTLPDSKGHPISLADFRLARALVVLFICNHCPYVQHIREALARIGRNYQQKGAALVAINSNDAARYPADSPEQMALEADRAGYTFPYLYDESQEVARAYRAACTPDIFVFNAERRLVYRGQFDDSRPGNGRPVTGLDLTRALDAILEGKPVPADQKPSIGCNIKWKTGHA